MLIRVLNEIGEVTLISRETGRIEGKTRIRNNYFSRVFLIGFIVSIQINNLGDSTTAHLTLKSNGISDNVAHNEMSKLLRLIGEQPEITAGKSGW